MLESIPGYDAWKTASPYTIEIDPKPLDLCTCGHNYRTHTGPFTNKYGVTYTVAGGHCFGEDCGCGEFEPVEPEPFEDDYDQQEERI